MTNAQHTPGPWVIHKMPNGESSGLVMGNGGSYHVCDTGVAAAYNKIAMPTPSYDIDLLKKHAAIAEANARLIAAAPELLEALTGIQKIAQLRGINRDNAAALNELLRDIHGMTGDAIAKATTGK